MMKEHIQCPVDFVLMNENKARMTAFFVLILGAIFLITGLSVIIAFLIFDFLLRANNLGKYSPLAVLSDMVIKQFKIGNKPTDRAPKKFAAGVGLVFTIGILVLTLLHLKLLALMATIILLIFAFLESFVGFCAGCYVYSFLKKLSKPLNNR